MSYQTDPNREMCRSFCIYDILQFFTHLLYIASCRVGFVLLRLCTGRVCTKLVYQALCFPFQYIKVARRQSQLHSLQQAASSNSGSRHVPCRNSSADVGSGARHWNAGQDGSKICESKWRTHWKLYLHVFDTLWSWLSHMAIEAERFEVLLSLDATNAWPGRGESNVSPLRTKDISRDLAWAARLFHVVSSFFLVLFRCKGIWEVLSHLSIPCTFLSHHVTRRLNTRNSENLETTFKRRAKPGASASSDDKAFRIQGLGTLEYWHCFCFVAFDPRTPCFRMAILPQNCQIQCQLAYVTMCDLLWACCKARSSQAAQAGLPLVFCLKIFKMS